MESINIAGIIAIFSTFGPVGIIALVWYFDMKAMRKTHADHKTEISTVLNAYKEDMAEMRQMYKNNVHLVEGYEDLAKDLKDIVILNTQQMTRLSDDIRQNEYCPARRVEKKQTIQEAGA